MTTSNVDSPSEEIESLLKLNMKKLSVLDQSQSPRHSQNQFLFKNTESNTRPTSKTSLGIATNSLNNISQSRQSAASALDTTSQSQKQSIGLNKTIKLSSIRQIDANAAKPNIMASRRNSSKNPSSPFQGAMNISALSQPCLTNRGGSSGLKNGKIYF